MINGIQDDTFIPMWINSSTALSNEVSSGLFDVVVNYIFLGTYLDMIMRKVAPSMSWIWCSYI